MKLLHGTALKRFVRDYRRAHPPARTLAYLLQSVEYPVNVGSIFRLADGAGVADVVLSGITPHPPHPTIDKVGRGKIERVPWRAIADPLAAVQALKADGYSVIAVELTETAQPYHTFDWPQRVALVVGHEDHGVTNATLAACDAAVFIPMYGKGLSLNVHVALAVVTYHVLQAA